MPYEELHGPNSSHLHSPMEGSLAFGALLVHVGRGELREEKLEENCFIPRGKFVNSEQSKGVSAVQVNLIIFDPFGYFV